MIFHHLNSLRLFLLFVWQVMTTDYDTDRCRVFGGGHLSSFDRTENTLSVGDDLLLHQSNTGDFEVRGRTWPCWYSSCVCSVKVRENGDEISVDMCDGEWSRTAPSVGQLSEGQLRQNVRVTKDETGKLFKVYMSSGRIVRVETHYWGMNVFVQSTSDDDENSFGLCGMTALNIATSVPSSVQADSDNYCACIVSEAGDEFDSEGCGFNTDVFQPISEYDLHREIDITNSLSTFLPRQQRSLTRRKQRSVFMPPEIEWPTANGVTQEEADRSCRWAIQNSSLADFCGDVEGVDLFIGVDGCVYDIGMTDGFEMVNNAVLMMEDLCEEMVLKNLSYYVQITSTDDIMAVPPSLIRHRCRFDCSGRGYCADGVCQCNEGYGDVDCSDLSKPPIIWSINGAYERYACNGAEEDCRSVSIIGNNFLNSPFLTCHFSQELEPATHTTAVAADEQTLTVTAATFISFWEVICQLPANLVTDHNSREIAASLSTLEIHVSNIAGVGLSNGLLFTEFDSECIDCDETAVCTPKAAHYVRQPEIFAIVFAMSKPLMPEKMLKRLHFHGKEYGTLHDHLPSAILPSDFGGQLVNYDSQDWFEELCKEDRKFEEYNQYGFSKDSETLGGVSQGADPVGGLAGSFRKLET
ncbi:von Willebrand factor D and EGF domain-containing protein-like [Ptychodera flava]|uniref:von Willebrand factor D and EGF domain-containing protein-like n=1 Tax=Ptychodera flava TaxID=63121 RepID=UPI00396A5C5D